MRERIHLRGSRVAPPCPPRPLRAVPGEVSIKPPKRFNPRPPCLSLLQHLQSPDSTSVYKTISVLSPLFYMEMRGVLRVGLDVVSLLRGQ